MSHNPLPSNFHEKSTILQNYTKAPVRIIPSSGQQDLTANDIVILTLPVGSVIDLRTFVINFAFETTGDATHMVGMPKWTSSLIDTMDIYVNGINVQHIPYYNWWYNTLKDFKKGHNEAIKQLNVNADPSTLSVMANTGVITKYNATTNTGVADINKYKGDFTINDFIGFLGECQPSIIDTSLFGTIEIHIRLASEKVLTATTGGTQGYTISKLYAYVDKLDFKDERYYMIQEQIMKSGSPLKIPYKNYRVHIGSELATGKESTTRFTESTNSLDKIHLSFLDGGRMTAGDLVLGDVTSNIPAATGADVAGINTYLDLYLKDGGISNKHWNYENILASGSTNLLNNSKYFRRNGLGVGTVQFEINSQDLPSFPLDLVNQYQETMKAMELNENEQATINPSIKSMNIYEKDFYLCTLSTSHINDKSDTTFISGLNTQATSMNVAVKVTQSTTKATNAAQKCTPIVCCEMTSILLVSAGRQISVIA